ncbi:phosphoenolpyruvate--protein phosphotransferase [Aerolutibacter ruishenii]|uniref:Phosphoenolpyruvate-protein phosphotransferase n=1 Tax=Aerolutibacter ruishenii TaxID=686800 RepID=A0A562LP93_9GAMM|nr:phosphoenolpyruvate--protein phosphotransferase [Lysobacter ruishenii]TWI09459.1 phosphotransferase system enzyme I (PtsI) [Lysobacter ruishenii]
MRQVFQGLGASRGSALGRARVRLPHALEVAEEHVGADEVEGELARLHGAIDQVRTGMHALRERLHGALAHEVGEFLDLHTLLLDDPELLQGLDALIRTGRYTADYALRLQRDRIVSVFEAMDDDYFRTRVDDIDQVIGRIHAALHRHVTDMAGVAGEILITDNVAPAELAQLQAQGVVAIVTAGGSTLSHSAILARSLHLPLVVGATQALQKANDGDALIVDGGSGLVVLEPGPDDLREHRTRERSYIRERKELHRLRREPTRTRDGHDIQLQANAESREDVAEAHALGATGIGLYRTEFLFLQRHELPDEEEQFRAYRDVVLGMSGRPVTIRTLDLGADKADRTGLALRDEPNPALGLRGVRLSMARTGLLDTQLRAALRASGYGPLRILVPMVTSREEIAAVRTRIKLLGRELRTQGYEIADYVPLGAMIEVPAAALALPGYIGKVDFLSIGTNDLVQYLLAADRNNEALVDLYTPLHPAVIRLLRDVIRLAHARGKSVAVCGEMAGDPAFTPLLLALGLTEFSLHPGTLLEVRRRIRECDLAGLKARAPSLMRARDRADIEAWLST